MSPLVKLRAIVEALSNEPWNGDADYFVDMTNSSPNSGA